MKGYKINVKISDILFIIAMIFVLGIPGPSRIKAIAIIAFWGYMMLVKLINNRSIKNNLHIIGSFLFLGYAYLSRKWALYPTAVFEQLTNVLWTVLLATAVSTYVIYNGYNVKDIVKRLMPVALIFVVNVFLNGSFSVDRLSIGINENAFGRLSSGVFCLFFYQCKQEKWRNVFVDVITALFLLFTFLSGSRTSVLMVVIYIAAFLVFEQPSKNAAKSIEKLLSVVVLCFMAYFCIMNIDFLYASIGNRIESLLELLTGVSAGDNSTISRMNMMTLAKELFLEHPWIGVGMNNFKYVTYYNTYAHSNYYELAACLGVVGLILYYLPPVYYLNKTISGWKSRGKEMIVPLAIIGAFLFGDIGSVSYFDAISSVWLGVAVGMANRKLKYET